MAESREELDVYRHAVPGAEVPKSVVCWHLERAPTLAAELERNGLDDFVVDNDDRPVRLVAEDMLTRAGWI